MNNLETAFKKRYNRDTSIVRSENIKDTTTLTIKSKKGTDISIQEFRKEGLTDYVIVKFGDKTHRFNRYIDGEVFIADLLGEEEYEEQGGIKSQL